jgi:hypothetical protein
MNWLLNRVLERLSDLLDRSLLMVVEFDDHSRHAPPAAVDGRKFDPESAIATGNRN